MSNLWADLNSEIPNYFGTLAKQYNLKIVRISDFKTALVSDTYALIISIDRFSVDIAYVLRNSKGNLCLYECGSFFAERYGEEDRVNLIGGTNARDIIIDNFIIISNGLRSKWGHMLNGEPDWINDFEKSKWYSIRNLNAEETNILNRYL